MPRAGKVEKRKIEAELIYKSPIVAKLINKVMVSGKKELAAKIIYQSFENIASLGQDPLKTFEKAIDNISPRMEVRPRRVGGASYLVPMEVRGGRRQSLALSWLVNAARSVSAKEVERPKNKPLMVAKLTREILQAAQGVGKAVGKRQEMQRVADANKAFAQFRW